MNKENEKFVSSSLFEGMTSIRSILKGVENGINDRKIIKILYSAEKEEARNKELRYLRKISNDFGFTVDKVSNEVIEELSLGNSHGGILAECSARTIPRLMDSKSKLVESGFYVMLDGIEDPYNFGYALRSIYASGANGIILQKRNWLTAAGVVARASAGASELCPLFTSDPEEATDFFKSFKYKIVCADKENAVNVSDANLKFPIFLIIGGEKRGIRASVLSKADEVVCIEYGRNFSAALSAASASAILSYEISRQNRK